MVDIKYEGSKTFIKRVTLTNLKHFLKTNGSCKPYSPIDTHIIHYTLTTAFNTPIYNKKVKYFKIEK